MMGNFTERNERNKILKEKKAAYYYDMSKLCFGGLVVGGIMQIPNADSTIVIAIFPILGIISTFAFLSIANKILKK